MLIGDDHAGFEKKESAARLIDAALRGRRLLR
jgi:hypothetical protein